MKIPFIFTFFIVSSSLVFSQTSYKFNISNKIILAKQLQKAIDTNWMVFDFKIGDITRDGKPDIITIGSSVKDDTENRKIFLFVNQERGLFKLLATNDKIIECEHCGGGGIGDPYQRTVILNNYFSFEVSYGDCDKTDVTIIFKFDSKRKWWFLFKSVAEHSNCNEQNSDGSIKVKEVEAEVKGGKIRFENYQ